MRKWCKSSELHGYLTVEAAVIIPFITFVAVVIMFICFYLYNDLISYHQASRSILTANNMLSTDADKRVSFLQKEYHQVSKGTRISISNEKGEITAKGNALGIRYSYETVTPLPSFLTELIGKDKFAVDKYVMYSKINPVMTVRTYRRAKDLLKEDKEK